MSYRRKCLNASAGERNNELRQIRAKVRRKRKRKWRTDKLDDLKRRKGESTSLNQTNPLMRDIRDSHSKK